MGWSRSFQNIAIVIPWNALMRGIRAPRRRAHPDPPWLGGLSHQSGIVGPRHVVQVTHRRLDVGVPHPLRKAVDVGRGDHARAKGVAQVVEAQRTEAGASQRDAVTAAQRGPVEVFALRAWEHQVVVADEPIAAAEPGEHFGDVGGHRDGSDLAGLG